MDEPKITTLAATGSVASRFVSATELDEAKKVKEEQWKAAYARLGQEPPPKMEEEEYDPRTLYEKLSIQKEAKREQWDEKMKMSNQWRGLEADELEFLAEVDDEAKQKEREKERADREQLAAFKAKQSRGPSFSIPATISPSPSNTLPSSISTESTSAGLSNSASTSPPAKPTVRSNLKAKLKGVVVKKRTPAAPPPPSTPISGPIPTNQPSVIVATPAPSVAVPATKAAPKDDPSKRKRLGGLLGIASGSDSSDDEGDAQPEKKKAKVDGL